ncbi:MAG TPA: hypothetical protein VFM65_01385, partial [Flavobacteriaceae bacterium]|nr:hypothetical protein [Flavobacteriaceae bacterium]
ASSICIPSNTNSSEYTKLRYETPKSYDQGPSFCKLISISGSAKMGSSFCENTLVFEKRINANNALKGRNFLNNI